MRIVPGVLGGALAAALLAVSAQAQVMDYGGLEEVFGEPVTISATGSPQRAADAPVNMEIITADDIRRSGADNIPDVLRFIAGVDVHHYGAASADVGIRGYNSPNSPRVLVLLNGRQIYVDFYGYTAWPTLPVQLEEIRQIEVIKGPNSALYGFNAVGGVINIVTFDPIFDSVNEVTARMGSQRNQQLSGVGTVRWGDRAGLRLSASEHGAKEPSPMDPSTYFGSTPAHAYNQTLYAHGRANLPSGVELTAEADFGRAKQYEMALGGYPAWTSYTTNRQKIGAGGESAIGYLNLDAYRNWVEYGYLAGYNCRTCQYIANNLIVVQASDLMKPAPDHSVRLGLEYRNNRVEGSVYAGENLGADIYAASAMWTWQVTPTVALTNSVRLDHMITSFSGLIDPGLAYKAAQFDGIRFTEPSFNSAAVYKPTGLDTVRLSAARGVQIPSFLDLFPQPVDPSFTVGPPNGQTFQGSPAVKPTVVMNYELDYTRSLPDILSKAKAAVFYQTSRELIAVPGDAAVTAGNGYNYASNIGSSEAIGGELGLTGSNAEGWRWRTGYAAVFIRDDLTVNRGQTVPNSSVDNRHGTPVHSVVLGLGRTLGPVEIDLNGRWQSSFEEMRVNDAGDALYRQHIDDYFVVDARVGWDVTEWLRLAVTGQQLNRTKQTVDAGPAADRRVFGTATVHY
ncbi:MAG: TonB-dependent receptor plug domain-containing protein [Actinomycetota bacterium]